MMLTFLLAALAAAHAAPWPTGDDPAPWEQREGGLEVQDVVVGTGPAVEDFAEAEVHYTGMLQDGAVFDSSVDRGETFSFRVGAHEVIKGWEQGLIGMKVGGTRRLVIPPELGYGSRSAGPIPPDSTLYFEVQLLGLIPPRAAPEALEPVPAEAWRVLDSGVRVADVVVGKGDKAKDGHRVCVDVATFADGAKTEDTYGRAGCSWSRLGDGLLPPGVEGALDKMRVGGVRQIEVPAALLDPNATGTRVFRVELTNTGK